jgi:hypothetical protein
MSSEAAERSDLMNRYPQPTKTIDYPKNEVDYATMLWVSPVGETHSLVVERVVH